MSEENEQRWYLAELLEEVNVEGDPRNVIRTNLVLLKARSAKAAYTRALEVGRPDDVVT